MLCFGEFVVLVATWFWVVLIGCLLNRLLVDSVAG